jgi:hypothetical protein
MHASCSLFISLEDGSGIFAGNVYWISTDTSVRRSYRTSKAGVVDFLGRDVEPAASADTVIAYPRVGHEVAFATVLTPIANCCQQEKKLRLNISR